MVADAKLTPEQLLYEVEDLLRTAPPWATIQEATNDNFDWLGRAAAIVKLWSPTKTVEFTLALDRLQDITYGSGRKGFHAIMVLLRELKHDLRMRTTGPTTVAVAQGRVFEYFEEVRAKIEEATEDILFVDPYLDADFVTRYFPSVRAGVRTRLLTTDKKLKTLLPAVEMFVSQNGGSVEVRNSTDLHDRFVFIDRMSGYQSGSSFKDGARNAPVTITQITDAFAPVFQTYEALWTKAKVERGPGNSIP